MSFYGKQLPFYLTRPSPCPYLPGQVEQKIFTQLSGNKTDDLLLADQLNRNGFRRSQTMLYRPACPTCMACVPVRIKLHSFTPTPRLRRVARRNADLKLVKRPAQDAEDLFPLFRQYQQARHEGGDMSSMEPEDFTAMLTDGGANAFLLTLQDKEGKTVAAMLVDHLLHTTSAVYSFYDVGQEKRSLGMEMILRLIGWSREAGLEHVYLGYWIKECRKMAYKGVFPSLERLGPEGWVTQENTI
jgi:arginyl-tRNA--protein-N-Asp/Glu arginylyltransferase